MASTVAEKPQYTFDKGYITEQSPVAVAEGSALDMENFEIDVTGALRRRRAIAQEDSGLDCSVSLANRAGDEVFTKYVWRNAGGIAGRVLQVIQVGEYLSFLNDNEALGVATPLATVDLRDFATASSTDAMIRTTHVSMADGRSHLFVNSENTEPFYVAFTNNDVSIITYNMRVRDFVGNNDGVGNSIQPTTLTTSHRYNLFNRGWTQTEIEDYFDDLSKYPSKNMTSNLGYKRVTNAGTQEGFGTKEWDSAKMEAEVFKDASAPQGSLLLNPFDTTVAYGNVDPTSGVSANIPIESWSFAAGTPTTVTIITTEPHGLSSGDAITIDNNRYKYTYWLIPVERSLDGQYTVTVVNDTTIQINVPDSLFARFTKWSNQYVSKGTVGVSIADGGGNIISSSEGYITDKRPAVIAWYAGRVWYFGTPHERLMDTAMFTPIIEGPQQYGLCYQQNDPTSDIFNSLLPTDGGTIRIAGLHGVKSATVLGDSLVVCAESGIWEIRGGQGGFAADNYLVRKISDAECTSKVGTARADSAVCVATKRGIYLIGYDRNSGLINAQNMTVGRVNTYWNSIPESKLDGIRLDYDDAKKRLYTLVSRATLHTKALSYAVPANRYTEALVYDFRIGEGGAFYKLSMPLRLSGDSAGYIGGMTILDTSDNSGRNKKVKFVYVRTATGKLREIAFCDMENSTFTDISGEEHVPFFRAAYDNTGDWHKVKRNIFCVYMFMGRTEQGFTEQDDELVPINPGSVLLQARWDWSDSSTSGKWSNPVQAYRPRAAIYNPTSVASTPEDGFPVIVTKNKIRGSGRALALYVYGEAGKDAHILGWLIQYGALNG